MAIPTGAVRYNTDSNKMEVYIGSAWMEVAVSSPNLDGGARGLAGGGQTPTRSNVIEFITIPIQSDTTDFGDLTVARQSVPGATGSSIRGVFAGGDGSPAQFNTIEYFNISTEGNLVDFGDISFQNQQVTGVSNGHGGLG